MSALLGISIREFAKRDGCDDKVVRRAISAQHLKTLEDGSLDPALVGTGWRKANRREDKGADVSAPAPAEDDDPLEEGSLELLQAGGASLAVADRMKANALALRQLLTARRMAGELVEAAHAERVLFEATRTLRDQLLMFPTKIGPLMAADLNVAPEPVVESLTAHVQALLEELGEPDADFAA